MQQSTQAENSFLNEFTKELIKNYYKLYLENGKEEKIQEGNEKRIFLTPAMPILPRRIPLQLPPQMQPPKIQGMIMPRQIPLQVKPPVQAYPVQIPPQKPSIQPISFNIPAGKTSFDKILPILNDQSVIKIEYRAENQPLFITRLGQTFPTKITLTEQEAMDILQEFSKQARIPLVKGVFRVYTKNFLVFAIISDFIKPRFIIQKTAFY